MPPRTENSRWLNVALEHWQEAYARILLDEVAWPTNVPWSVRGQWIEEAISQSQPIYEKLLKRLQAAKEANVQATDSEAHV